MAQARWMQCERVISEYGFLAKHPTTGVPIPSPYVTMEQNYLEQANKLWGKILKSLKEDSDDDLEKLLSSHK